MAERGLADGRRGAEPGLAPPPGTPAGWRFISLAALGGGLAVGFLLATSPAAAALSILMTAVAVGQAIPIARAGRLGRVPARLVPAGSSRASISVLIPVRDEATVIGRLIGDLAAQDHRAPDGIRHYEIIVIDDRSSDGTDAAARAAAALAGVADILRIIRRDGVGLPDGKGAALTAAQPDDCRGEIVVVLDGDARVAPGFLRTLAAHVDGGAVAVTPRRRTTGARTSWLAAAQAVEQAQDGALQRGRWSSGGCSEFRGNGITVRRGALEAVGGWRAEALTEDLDLSSRLAARLGVTVAWAIDAVVEEEPVRSWPALWRQRVRWAEGSIRRLLEHGRAVTLSPRLSIRARVDFLTYALQPLAAPVVGGTILGAAWSGRPVAAAVLVGGYLAAAGLLAWVGLGREAAVDGAALTVGDRLRKSIGGALFTTLWLAAIPAALWRLATRRGAVRYEKMVHGDAAPAVVRPG
jgi:1,2-diacylglycerol 3-beta-glucosyltransferase